MHTRFYCQRDKPQPNTSRGLLLVTVVLLVSLLFLGGCAKNPVTGKNEIMLIPESMELEMGEKNYQPARQMQGGDYVTNPEVVAYIQEVGQKLVAVSDRELPYEFTVLNNSEINAWAMPGGKLAINRGLLLKMDSEAELAAVLGHEIVHAAAKHGAQQMQEGMLMMGAMLATSLALGDDELLQDIGMLGVQVAANLLSSKFSRDDERESDHYGMVYMSRAGYDPYGAVKMQEVLLKESQSGDHDLLSTLFSSHPPSQERVDTNRGFAATLPAGKTGKDEYHRRLASLFKAAPAYVAYDEGEKAIEAKDFKKARSLAEKAIRIEPNEAQFHLLRGYALEKSSKTNAAVKEYRKAVQMDPTYYQSHLLLGLLLDSKGYPHKAKQSFEKSMGLLKTTSALQRLGSYALADGNTDLARTYLSEAATSNTEDGKKAYAELLGFDLSANASKYINVKISLDTNNRLRYVVQNNTPFAISHTVVEVFDASGRRSVKLNAIVQGNQQRGFQTKKQLTQDEFYSIRVKVVTARLAQ